MLRFLVIGLLIFAAVAIRLLLAHAALVHLPVNADEVMTFLQAKEIAESGTFPLFFWTQPYQFPLEAYMVSMVFKYLSWDTIGVRVVQLTLCLLAVPGFYLVFRELGNWQKTWPGVLLILFPSAYWLTRQVAHMTPQHAMSVTFAWLIPLAAALSKRSRYPFLFCGLGGLVCGLALSNHLLMASFVAMGTAYICLGDGFADSLKRVVSFLPGLLCGLAPYLYAKFFVPGAYQTVTDTNSPLQALSRVWDPILTDLLPTGLGIDPHFIPDAINKNERFHFLVVPSTYLFAALLVSLTIVASWRFFSSFRQHQWPRLELFDVFLGTTWIALALLAMTDMDVRVRYTLPIVWSFPFLVAYLYSVLAKAGRIVLGSLALCLVAINCVNAVDIARTYKMPNFAAREIFLDDLTPLYSYFERHGITRCYAGWWLAYRIVFETKEEIICSPPFNDRFAGWPQPFYRRIVDESNNTPYIYGHYQHPLLRYNTLEPYLAAHKFHAREEWVGAYKVYREFYHADVPTAELVSDEKLESSASIRSEDAGFLTDGDLSTVWRSGLDQDTSMSIGIELSEETSVHALRLFSLHANYKNGPPRVRIEARGSGGAWREIVQNLVGHPYLIKTERDRNPYHFEGLELTFGFSPVSAKAFRIQIVEPVQGKPWELAEVQLLTGAAAALSK